MTIDCVERNGLGVAPCRSCFYLAAPEISFEHLEKFSRGRAARGANAPRSEMASAASGSDDESPPEEDAGVEFDSDLEADRNSQ